MQRLGFHMGMALLGFVAWNTMRCQRERKVVIGGVVSASLAVGWVGSVVAGMLTLFGIALLRVTIAIYFSIITALRKDKTVRRRKSAKHTEERNHHQDRVLRPRGVDGTTGIKKMSSMPILTFHAVPKYA
ncbi:hypothetical protein BC830DRAFT_1175728 [Chytriomyces sp. MP71]|nr:hypothetical protein BC830DRAFT_1175728 [Chytriomyces sp. MP71]